MAYGKPIAYGQRSNWMLQVYDQNGNLVDIPQSDVESIQIQKVLNGGSGEATITFHRRFNDVGAIGYTYSFRLWIWPANEDMPTDPYWTGIQEDPDQVQLSASGQAVVHAYGDFTMLNDAIVSLEANPDIDGNPSLDCGDLLRTLLGPNQPPGWLTPVIPTTMFPMLQVTYTHEGLADVLDDILQQGRDSTGLLYVWYVKVTAAGERQIVIQIDQNPNVLDGTGGKPLVRFRHLFANSDFDTYKISTKYRDLVNVVAVYGAKDPTSGAQAYGVFEDSTSISEFGRIKEAAITIPALQTSDACKAYGEVWLDLNAYPSAEGSCRLLVPDPTIDVGTWVQFWEAPEFADSPSSIKQVRITQIDLTISKPNRIEQVLTTTSPVPYLDKAIYRMGNEIQQQTQIGNSPISVNRQRLYIRSGGILSSSSDSPAKVALTACQAVFPDGNTDGKTVKLAAYPLTKLTDNSGGPNDGETGDGNYTVSVTSSKTWVVTKGDRPANVKTQQNVLGAYVVNGVPFCVDIRILAGYPGFSDELPSISLASGHTVLVGICGNSGAGAVDLPIDFWLDPDTWTAANPRLSYFEIGAVPHGSVQPISTYTKVVPTDDGHIDCGVPGVGAGSTYDFYVTAFDNLDRPTQALFLCTVTADPVKVGMGNVDVDSSLAAPNVSNNGSISNVADPVDTGHPHPTQGDISVAPNITNIPTDGSVSGVLFAWREHGTTPWNPDGIVDVVGLPTPAAAQTISYIYGAKPCGKLYDFACCFVALGGYGAVTQFGTTAQQANGFKARALTVTGPYLDNGSLVSPSVGGTKVATLTAKMNVNDLSASVDDTSGLVVGQEIEIDSESFVIDSIDSGASTATMTEKATASHANGSAITAAFAWNGLSANGVSAEVNVQFDITNLPTDGTCAQAFLLYRRHNSHANKWTVACGQPAPGKLTDPETYPSSASFFFGIADLVNGDVYDICVVLLAASGRESAKTVIISGFAAQTLVLPTSSLPTIPDGTTVTATGTITGYTGVEGGTYHTSFDVTPSLKDSDGNDSDSDFRNWGSGFMILAKVNDTGSVDSDTNQHNYFRAGEIMNNTWSGGSLTAMTSGLSAGHAFQLAIAPLDQARDLGPLAIFALTTAQYIGSGTIRDGPNKLKDPEFDHHTPFNSAGKALRPLSWWTYGFDGDTVFLGIRGRAKGANSIQIQSNAFGSGVGARNHNIQAMSQPIRLDAGTTYCISAYLDASESSAGTATGVAPPSIALITHKSSSPGSPGGWDFAKNDPSNVSFDPQIEKVLVEAAQDYGLVGQVYTTYTPSEDLEVSFLWQSHGTHFTDQGVFALPQLQEGDHPGPFNYGGHKTRSERPEQEPVNADAAFDDQGGADPGTGGGIFDHTLMSWQAQARIGADKTLAVDSTTGPVSGTLPRENHDPSLTDAINSAGNIVSNPFGSSSGASINLPDGAIIGIPVGGLPTEASYPGMSVISVNALIQSADTVHNSEICVGDPSADGYSICWFGSGAGTNEDTVCLVRYASGTPTVIATLATAVAPRTTYYSQFQLLVDIANKLVWAAITSFRGGGESWLLSFNTPVSDSSGPWTNLQALSSLPVHVSTGGASGKVLDLDIQVGKTPYAELSDDVQAIIKASTLTDDAALQDDVVTTASIQDDAITSAKINFGVGVGLVSVDNVPDGLLFARVNSSDLTSNRVSIIYNGTAIGATGSMPTISKGSGAPSGTAVIGSQYARTDAGSSGKAFWIYGGGSAWVGVA